MHFPSHAGKPGLSASACCQTTRPIMTHNEFNHLLSGIKALSRGQMRQLRQKIDCELSRPEQPKKPSAQTAGMKAKHSRLSRPASELLPIDDPRRAMMESGLILSLPDPTLDIDDDDPADASVVIKGEPLSETILRERR